MKSLPKFAFVHANVRNHFDVERHLVNRRTCKQSCSAALAEWQALASQAAILKGRAAAWREPSALG